MRKVIVVISVLFLLATLTGYMLLNKKHRTVEDEEYTSLDATQLFDDFKANEVQANAQYLDKVLEVTGIVSEVRTNQNEETVVLLRTNDPFFGVSCTLRNNTAQIEPETQITVKGICTGYLSDVVLTRGVLITE